MGLNIGVARANNHHIRLQLVGKLRHFVTNVAAANVNLNVTFRQARLSDELSKFFLRVFNKLVFHFSRIGYKPPRQHRG